MKLGITIKLYAQITELCSTLYFWEQACAIDVHGVQSAQEALAIIRGVSNPESYQPRVVSPGSVPFSESGVFGLLQESLDVDLVLSNSE